MTRGSMKFLTAAMFAVVALWGWGGMHFGSTAHAGPPSAEQPAATPTPTPTPGSDESDESAPDTCVEDEAVSDTNDVDPTCPPSPSPTPTATPVPTPTPTPIATPTPTPAATEQAVTGGVLGTTTGPPPVQATTPTVPAAGIGLPYGIAALIAGIGALILLGARRRRLRG